MSQNKITVILLICSMLSGCISKNTETPNPEELYKTANDNLARRNYDSAIKDYEKLENEFPSSNLVHDSALLKAYSLYAERKYSDAIERLNDFLSEYPASQHVDYAYYLKALCYYNQILDIGRDQTYAHEAVDTMEAIMYRFKDTKYAQDIKYKLNYVINVLAGKEMEIGRFYLESGKFVPSIQRFQNVVNNYSKTVFIEEALFRIIEVLHYIEDDVEAKKYMALLQYNYPQSIWCKRAGQLVHNNEKQW